MSPLVEHAGTWVGTNEFRLMPTDPFQEAPATADVSIAAAGNLASVVYTWIHPDDGAQDGLLVVGSTDEPDGVVALWADSWHQSPASRVLAGAIVEGRIVLTCEYGEGWGWQITVDATTATALHIRMDNVVPESAAGPQGPAGAYAAMLTALHRAT